MPRYGGYDDDSFKRNEPTEYSTLTSGEKVQGRLCSMCQHGTRHFCVNCCCCRHICNCGHWENAASHGHHGNDLSLSKECCLTCEFFRGTGLACNNPLCNTVGLVVKRPKTYKCIEYKRRE